jgi:APA family basic amino acid/polyamine antiporter
MALKLFRKKSPDLLLAEAAAPERQLKRTLGPIALTAIGIGAVIGAGIFSLTGTAAAGQTFASGLETPVINFLQSWFSGTGVVLGRAGAGPAIAASFIVAGIACAFAALCYAELASMIPVSGSAYTYSYATMGEIVAWIIGWDLILEYAVGNMAVAVSWSGYFVQLCDSLFHLKFPLWLVNDHQTATDLLAKGGAALEAFSSSTLPVIAGHSIAFNLPALLIVAAVTVILVYGIRESAQTNTTIVIIKVAVVVFVIAFGAFMVNPTNWHPFMPHGFPGLMSGAAIVFFAFIGFDAVSTTAEETRNPQRDMPIGIIVSLIICTVLYVLMSAVLTGIKKIHRSMRATPLLLPPLSRANRGRKALVSAGALAGTTSVLLGVSAWAATHFHGDGARRFIAALLCQNSSPFPHTAHHDNLDWSCCRCRSDGYKHRRARRPHEHRHALRVYFSLSRRQRASPREPGTTASVSRAVRSGFPDPWRADVPGSDAEPAGDDLDSFCDLARNRARDLFSVQRAAQQAAAWN